MTGPLFRSLASAALCLSSCAPAMALSITLPKIPTAWLNANAYLNFSEDAISALDLAKVQVTALGSASDVANATYSYNLPITSVTARVGFKPLVEPVAGEVMGAALDLSRGQGKDLILGNFAINFTQKVISGDAWLNGIKSTLPIFTFEVDAPLSITLKGGLALTEQLNHLSLTDAAADSFVSALKIPPVLKSTLTSIDFGNIDIRINPSFRKPWFNGKAFVPPVNDMMLKSASLMPTSPVPEPSAVILMLLGLVGLTAISHRLKRI